MAQKLQEHNILINKNKNNYKNYLWSFLLSLKPDAFALDSCFFYWEARA
jgi:hypothetical protein